METILRVPEFILFKGLKAGIAKVIKDYQDFVALGRESECWLAQLCNGIEIERYNFYTQLKKVLITEEDDPRKLEIDLMFNMKINAVPHVYISLPGEQYNQRGNTLGIGEGFGGYQFIDTEGDDDIITDRRSILTRRKQAVYSIVIVSDNTNEVIALYHFFNALIISLQGHFALQGLENLTYGGRDIEPYSELAPPNIFMRAIQLGLEYNTQTLTLPLDRVFGDLDADGKPINS